VWYRFIFNSTNHCDNRRTPAGCNSKADKGCVWQTGPRWCTHRLSVGCAEGTSNGPECNFVYEYLKHCDGISGKANCIAKRGCIYDDEACVMDYGQQGYALYATAAKLNLKVGIAAMKVDEQCKAIKDELTCNKTVINSAGSVARTGHGAVLMAVVVLAVTAMFVL
jgi:hypothetical protein